MMKRTLTTLLIVFACCVMPPPVSASMKPVAAGKVESATEKRARILKARQEARKKKELEELEAKRKKEAAEREAQWKKEAAEREAQWKKEAAEREAQLKKEREEAAAANRAYYEEQDRRRAEREAREQAAQEQARAEEEAKWKEAAEAISRAGLPEGWKNHKGIVRVDEMLTLKRPLVVFLREDEARRYMTWMRADAESAQRYALERAQEDTAFVIPEGSKVIVTLCEEDGDEGDIPAHALFYVSTTDDTEGWASNLILREHREPGKKTPRKKR